MIEFLFLLLFLLVYCIVNEEANAESCKEKIKAYEEANRTQIVIRQSQRADEERAIQDQIAAEQREFERRKRDLQEEEKAVANAKRKFKQESTEVLLGVSMLLILFWFLLWFVSLFVVCLLGRTVSSEKLTEELVCNIFHSFFF